MFANIAVKQALTVSLGVLALAFLSVLGTGKTATSIPSRINVTDRAAFSTLEINTYAFVKWGAKGFIKAKISYCFLATVCGVSTFVDTPYVKVFNLDRDSFVMLEAPKNVQIGSLFDPIEVNFAYWDCNGVKDTKNPTTQRFQNGASLNCTARYGAVNNISGMFRGWIF